MTRPELALRVCLVAPVPPPYGGIAHWSGMIRRYAMGRTDVELSSVDTAPRWRSIHDLRLWRRVLGGGAQFGRNITKLLWLLLVRRPNVIHLTTSGQLALYRDLGVVALGRLAGVPTTYHIRFGRVPEIAASQTREWKMIRRVMSRCRTVVVIDESTEECVRSHMPEVRLRRIPNCIVPGEVPLSANAGNRPPTVVYVGWVIPTKGIEELVDAWMRLGCSEWELKIVGPGDGAYRKHLVAKYCATGVEFMGELPHAKAMEIVADASVFVLPSHTEGFPNVVLEAMLLGRPIIATRVGAIPEMLADGCGILVDPKNAQDLTEALSRVLQDDNLRSDLGAKARSRAISDFSIDTVFEQLMDVWRDAARVAK